VGVAAAAEFATLAADRGLSPAVAALGWLAQLDGVTTVIPGARNVGQAQSNASAGSLPPLELDESVRELYDRRFRDAIHARW
jgi:aryl-alcohol dehydrogenase-like predicted oxidoreductase